MIRTTPWFIAIEKDSFVALDMRMGLEEACPGCRIDTVTSPTDLPDLLGNIGPITPGGAVPVILTSMSIDRVDQAGLPQMLDGRGAIIVQREGADPAESVNARGYLRLPSPFSTDDFRKLYDMLRDRLQPPAALG